MTEQGPEQYADAARRYRLDDRIATGGMGVVWRATDTRLNRQVAVKVLKHEYADDPTFRARFETEARHAASLHHSGIAGIFDYAAEPESLGAGAAPYLVMELVEGAPLSTLLSQAKSDGRSLDPDVVRDLMAQAADALAVAHRAGIVHRDVKPANLMVTPDGRVKVTDFGIARAADAAQITRTGAVMGTPQYLSPEQARGNAATPASDVYSLGVVTFECLTGRRPFEAETPVATALAHLQQPVPDLPASVPADLAAVVRRALTKEPADRFTDGHAFAAALRNPAGAAAAGAAAAGAGAAGAVPTDAATAVIPPVGPTPQPTAETPRAMPLPPASAAPTGRKPEPAGAYQPPADEGSRPRSPWPAVLIVLLLVAVAVLLAWLLLGGDDETPVADDTEQTSETTEASTPTSEATTPTTEATTPTTEPTTPTTTAAPTVDLDPGAYEGRPYPDVQSDLQNLNLNVTLSEVGNDGTQTEDAVQRIDPFGEVAEGSLITVYYYGPPPVEVPTDELTTEEGQG